MLKAYNLCRLRPAIVKWSTASSSSSVAQTSADESRDAFRSAFKSAPAKMHIPLNRRDASLRMLGLESRFARMEKLRRRVTQLIREERVEWPVYMVMEARPYAERLIQMVIEYGLQDDYTKEMVEWWMIEKDLVHKLQHVIAPRYAERYLAGKMIKFTRTFNLPMDVVVSIMKGRQQWRRDEMQVLELYGNPFPPVDTVNVRHDFLLVNVLLSNARMRREEGKESKGRTPSEMVSEAAKIYNSVRKGVEGGKEES